MAAHKRPASCSKSCWPGTRLHALKSSLLEMNCGVGLDAATVTLHITTLLG